MENTEVKISEELQSIINHAGMLSHEQGLTHIEPIYLSVALFEKSSFINHFAKNLGIDVVELEQFLNNHLPESTTSENDQSTVMDLSPQSREILEASVGIAKNMNEMVLTAKHLFVALSDREKHLRSYLKEKNISQKTIIEKLNMKDIDETQMSKMPNDKLIKKFTTDLTALAKDDKIDPIIGRSEEIRRIIQTLSRKTKNNPVLVGEAGVGKTAIVEGVATRIARNDVPDSLKNITLLVLDLGSLIAGSKYRGEFEDRLKKVIDYAEKSQGQVILFIDEIHTLVGAGKLDGAMDAANLLKPALGRGLIRLIGATTLDEYRRFIEKDPALERRMQMINVPEPSLNETISILRGIKERYELFHRVDILDDAIDAAVSLSDRYLPDRKLPDKAIDLIDETASRTKVELESMPEEVDNLERRIHQLQIEIRGLQRKSQSNLGELEKKTETETILNLQEEKQKLDEELYCMKNAWLKEKENHQRISSLRKEIDALNNEKNRYEVEAKYDKVAEIVYGQLPQLKEKLQQLEKEETSLKKSITSEDVRETLSKWTGIPVNKLSKNDSLKYLYLENNLKKEVIDQDDAVKKLSNAICRNRAGLSNPDKPIGSFLFLGPTGVGKTALARALAHNLFDDVEKLFRIDMSEMMEPHSVSKLIGAPPGYVGFDHQHGLLNQIRNQPYSVLLFDEVEKAHPDVLNVLLQILDNGRLTNSEGKVINFKNTIIILTSNLAAETINQHHSDSKDSKERQQEIDQVLRKFFRIEFLNRIDDIIVFNPLSISTIEKIFDLEIVRIQTELKKRNVIITISDFFRDILVRKGFNPEFGARSLKRTLDTELLNPIAKYLLEINHQENHREGFSDKKEGKIVSLEVDYVSGKVVIKPLETRKDKTVVKKGNHNQVAGKEKVLET